MYKVYGTVRSRAFRVIWALEELGQPYELVTAGPHSDEIRAVNRWGKIPAMQVGDDIITDSTAIMTYLADAHGDLTYPAGTIERAKQDAMTNRILDEMDSALWVAARHKRLLPEDKRVPGVAESCEWEFELSLKRLSKDFDGPFLMGERMTIADILAVHCLGWARSEEFPAPSDTLKAYAKTVQARPAFRKALTLESS